MASKNLMLQIKVAEEFSEEEQKNIQVAKIKTADKTISVDNAEFLKDIIAWTMLDINSEEYKKIIRCESVMEDLAHLLEQGFTLKIYENENEFKVVISKGSSAAVFEASKQNGVVDALMQANDWAEQMLIELGITTRV